MPYLALGEETSTRCLAREVGRHGIRVVSVVPGWIATESNRPGPGDQRWIAENIALGRVGQPAEIAEVVWFLAGGQCPTSPDRR